MSQQVGFTLRRPTRAARIALSPKLRLIIRLYIHKSFFFYVLQVYKGLWKGTVVAVKTIVLPAAMSGQEKREKMAIMEAAISSTLSHPNIMQVCVLAHFFYCIVYILIVVVVVVAEVYDVSTNCVCA